MSSSIVSTPSREAVPPDVVGQFSWGLVTIFVLSSVCWAVFPYTGSMFPALLFLLAIVLAGTRWSRGPVLAMAVVSALVWNFIFIQPRFTFHIEKPEDLLMFGLFFVVALSMGHLITRIREREEALAVHHREREQLLEDKHRAEIAAEAERLHRTLLDSVSHELKTPVAIIRTAIDGLGTENPFAAEIDTAARRLQRLVEHFIEITRLESDAVKPAPDWCEFEDILHTATESLERELESHPLNITGADELPLLKVDGRLLGQALANVLHNASFYAPAKTGIDLSVSYNGSCLELSVRDRGSGLPPDSEDRIFEKFYRDPDARAGGTGLGLAISRGLLRAMKGDIVARNHPEGGAEFVLSVPVATRQP
jgi:two-component system, OmpR family, sensor histidine kinase KdpD